jgi:hypothetical protein
VIPVSDLGRPEATGHHTFAEDLTRLDCVDCGAPWPCPEFKASLVRGYLADAARIREFMACIASNLANLVYGMTGEQVRARLVDWIADEFQTADTTEPMDLTHMAELLEPVAA